MKDGRLKNVVIGITGGIAAYKSANIVSRLKKEGFNVHVIMTESACEFVAPLTFQTLSQNAVITDMFAKTEHVDVEHISLATLADVFLICPATANIIGKIANGIADDFLSTTVMATKAPVVIAPAMNTAMYENQIVKRNIDNLKSLGYNFVDPDEGRLACGTSGAGRLAADDAILDAVHIALCKNKDLAGKNVLVTAGPTREAFDPVRFITNRSSGKMGYAIARAAKIRGANVTLVTGHSELTPFSGVNAVKIESAQDMQNAVNTAFDSADIVIKAAAPADYRPACVSAGKIKKTGDLCLDFVKNPDILRDLGARKGSKILVGFCMETENLIKNAEKKLTEKNLDFIVANDLTTPGAGFGTDTNAVTILSRGGERESLDIMSKNDLANVILDRIISLWR